MTVDNSKTGLFGLFGGGYSSNDPSMNVSLSSSPSGAQLSPYLSIDTSYLQNQPEFISLEGYAPRRGRFEMAFSQIGGAVLVGGAAGGVQGLYRGIKETSMEGLTANIRRTQLINYVSKRVSGTANAVGVISVFYSGIGCILFKARGDQEDNVNTLASGALTGLLYQSSGGLKKAGIGGAVGLCLAGLFVACTSREKIRNKYGYN